MVLFHKGSNFREIFPIFVVKREITMRRIVVAFDSFKGSLTSREAGEAFAQGFRDVVDAHATIVGIADGGEGTAEVVAEGAGGMMVTSMATDPLGRSIEAQYAIVKGGTMAVIAMSAASGLTLVEADRRNPVVATTYGTGELIKDALRRGCRDIVVGLGGSATNDGGVGMLRALGYRFYDSEGVELCETMDILERVCRVSDECRVPFGDVHIVAATDVDNPLCGPRGATYVYARQKGADEAMMERLEAAMQHYAQVVDAWCGRDASNMPGAGAAGGVGYAMSALLGVELRSGIDMVLDVVDFDDAVVGADLVVTGEGRVDRQTLMGKAPAGVARRAQRLGVPCVAVGGSVAWADIPVETPFAYIDAATPASMPLDEAMRHPVAISNLRAAGSRVARWWLENRE